MEITKTVYDVNEYIKGKWVWRGGFSTVKRAKEFIAIRRAKGFDVKDDLKAYEITYIPI